MGGHRHERAAQQPGKNRVLVAEHPLDARPQRQRRVQPGGEKQAERPVRLEVRLHRGQPARNGTVQDEHGQQCAAQHDRSLDEIRPDDGLDPAERRVDGGQHDHADARKQVDQEEPVRVGGHGGVEDAAGSQFVNKYQRDGRHVDARPRRQHACDQKHGARGVLGPRAEPPRQVLVDGIDVEPVIGREKNEADDDPGEDRPEGQLDEEVVALVVAFAGRAEEGARAGFRSDERGQDGPPGNLASAEGELAE